MKLEHIYLKIDPSRFHYLKFILEGYDGLSQLSNHDIAKGIVRLRYEKSCQKEMFTLLDSLAPSISSF
ncbi:MAG: DUF4911 domain-containing protein [Thermodesulfobacteriota bacterium]